MQFQLLLLAGLSSLATAISLAANTTNTTCQSYVIVSTRGSLEQQGPSEAFVGMINSTMHAVPNGTTYDTVYSATLDHSSSLNGTKSLIDYIRTSHASCPFQKYILLGYSQGATVPAGALQQICEESPEGEAILAILTVGNPVRKAFQASNLDEEGGKATDMYFGSLYQTDRPAVPKAWYSSGKYLDICHKTDLVCSPTAPGLGDTLTAHLSYGNTTSVQYLGARFLANRLYGAGLAPVTPQTFGIS